MSNHFEILKKHSVRAKKSFGQNFLVNDGILKKIATAILVQNQNIIEVWPGYGALTGELLAQHPASLTLIELDPDMVQILESRVVNQELSTSWIVFQIIQQDILKYDPVFSQYSVIANIPYYITSPILYHFLYEVSHLPETMIILLQRDVGDKIRKVRGNKSSVLSLFIELACDHIEEICRVSPGSFIPAPKVESSVLSFSVKKDFDSVTAKQTLEIIKIGFSERRKKLISNLEKGTGHKKWILASLFPTLWLDENVRAEELSIDTWQELTRLISSL